ncbi:MAG: hypothetical protein CTY37_00350 [Methylotenera sp.]|nr:MAG: hypothetical protein CTY37_00350 [Methylotenera sp.]
MKNIFLLLSIVSFCNGCTHISGLWRVDDIDEKKDKASLIDLDQAIIDVNNETKDKQNALRNQKVYALIKASDKACEVHKSKIISNGSTSNFVASSSALTLAGLSAIASGVAARNLAAASSIVTGSTAEYNSNIYYGIIVPAIIREISKDRTNRLSKIKGKLGNQEANYPIEEAFADAMEYHHACSFYNGLLLVTEDKTTKSLSYEEIKTRLTDIEARISATTEKVNNVNTPKEQISALNVQLNSLETSKLILLNQLQAQAPISFK